MVVLVIVLVVSIQLGHVCGISGRIFDHGLYVLALAVMVFFHLSRRDFCVQLRLQRIKIVVLVEILPHHLGKISGDNLHEERLLRVLVQFELWIVSSHFSVFVLPFRENHFQILDALCLLRRQKLGFHCNHSIRIAILALLDCISHKLKDISSVRLCDLVIKLAFGI